MVIVGNVSLRASVAAHINNIVSTVTYTLYWLKMQYACGLTDAENRLLPLHAPSLYRIVGAVMKIKQKVVAIVAGLLAVVGFGAMTTLPAFADCTKTAQTQCCGGAATSIISCTQTNSTSSGVQGTGVWALLILAINILTAGVGIAAVGGLVYGAILYSSAGGSADQVKKAKDIIGNVIIGLVAYALMFAFLNFLIPGGVFNQ